MQWWNEFLAWFESSDGQAVLVTAVLPFTAILVAGIVAAAIGRGSTKRLLTLNDRENRVAAVATMIGSARRASVWSTLSDPEQQHADHVASEADVRVRLLAVPGSGLAADWAAHELAAMKRNSVSFSFQAEQSLLEFRDRMVQWQAKPGRAKKLFKNDLDLWSYEDSQATKDIISQQQEWAASQVAAETSPSPSAGAARSTADASNADASNAGATTADRDPASSPYAPVAPRRPPAGPRISDLADDSGATPPDGAGVPPLVEPESVAASSLSGDQSRPKLGEQDRGDRDEPRPGADQPVRAADSEDAEPEGMPQPVAAETVARRIHPPKVGEESRGR